MPHINVRTISNGNDCRQKFFSLFDVRLSAMRNVYGMSVTLLSKSSNSSSMFRCVNKTSLVSRYSAPSSSSSPVKLITKWELKTNAVLCTNRWRVVSMKFEPQIVWRRFHGMFSRLAIPMMTVCNLSSHHALIVCSILTSLREVISKCFLIIFY